MSSAKTTQSQQYKIVEAAISADRFGGNDVTSFDVRTSVVELSLFESLDKHGMTHPIIISWNAYSVSVGHQRVWYAKSKGYTHIDCYHVENQTQWEKVFNYTANEEYLK